MVRRLKSGKLLLLNHEAALPLPGEIMRSNWRERKHLAAWLSDDDGKSWYGRLMIDERTAVSYPDFAEGEDGFIYVIYDRERVQVGQVLLARFTEADIACGEFRTPGGYSRLVVSAFPEKTSKQT